MTAVDKDIVKVSERIYSEGLVSQPHLHHHLCPALYLQVVVGADLCTPLLGVNGFLLPINQISKIQEGRGGGGKLIQEELLYTISGGKK